MFSFFSNAFCEWFPFVFGFLVQKPIRCDGFILRLYGKSFVADEMMNVIVDSLEANGKMLLKCRSINYDMNRFRQFICIMGHHIRQ